MSVWRDSSARGALQRSGPALAVVVIVAGLALLVFALLRWAYLNPPPSSIDAPTGDGADLLFIPRYSPIHPRFDDYYIIPMTIGAHRGA